MPRNRDRFRVQLDVNAAAGTGEKAEPRATPAQRSGEASFRIALLGDFSGRANRGDVETGRALATRRPIRVDRDTLDDAIARLRPSLELAFPGTDPPIDLRFSTLEDFHPDRLLGRLAPLGTRRESDSPAETAARPPRVNHELTRPPPLPPGALLDAILDATPWPPGGAAIARTPVAELHSLSGDDDATAAEMRELLHHRDFQALEALWRGVDFLVRRLETGPALQLYLIDLARDEIATDLHADRLEDSGVYRLLVDQSVGTQGAPAWALLVGCYSFGAGEEDTALLDRLAAVAQAGGAPLVAAADPSIAGAASLADTRDPDDWNDPVPPEWEGLRHSAHARSVGLVFPRLLLRLPYGERTNACELLPFEEVALAAVPTHDSYLWGTGALAVALLVGEAVAETGGAGGGRRGTSIAGLPLHVYKHAGEAIATPCAEVLLTERVVERLLSRGLTPLVWVRDTDVVVLPRLQSVAEPATPLAGRWSTAADVEDR